jgi:hypothetical protein
MSVFLLGNSIFDAKSYLPLTHAYSVVPLSHIFYCSEFIVYTLHCASFYSADLKVNLKTTTAHKKTQPRDYEVKCSHFVYLNVI